MGLLDALLGRTKPVRANLDALFALPSAAVTLQSAAGLVLSGRAGVCWKPPAAQQAADVQREIAELLDIPDDSVGPTASPGLDAGPRTATTANSIPDDATAAAIPAGAPTPAGVGGATGATPAKTPPAIGTLTQAEDSYGYRWLLLDDPDIEDLVTRVHMINSTLTDNGWGPQLLCSVFGVVPGPDADRDAHRLYLVYLYKRGTFYPFAPQGHERRDSELELRIRAVIGSDLPFEQDLSRWFPLWDAPIH